MADDKLTDRVELAETPNDNDFFYVVDVSDSTDDITGSSKKIKYSNFKNGSGGGGLSAVVDDTTPQLGGNLDGQANNITNVTDYEVKGEAYADVELNNGNSSTAITIDWTSKNYQNVTLTDTCVFTFTAPSGVTTLILKLTQDATGSRTVTFPASVLWSSGTAPTLTTDANAVDLISFYYDGSNYIGGFLSDVK